MKLTITDLQKGITWWIQHNKWPWDFHNAVYHKLYDLRKDGLSNIWWDSTVDRLWEWKAIRPATKNEISTRGLEVLPLLRDTYINLRSKAQGEPCFLNTEWPQIADLYGIMAGVKNCNSPVFPSKLGHFIFPKLFIVMDSKATGTNDYQVFWQSMHEAWNSFEEREEAVNILTEEIVKNSALALHKDYPFEIKIIELCSIGKKHNGFQPIANKSNEQVSLALSQKQDEEAVMNLREDTGDFVGFEKWMLENVATPATFSTLARGVPFTAQYSKNDGSVTITNSLGKSYTIRRVDIRIIFERWKTAPYQERYMTKTYGLGSWSGCPHRDAPAIAAIIKRWARD